MSLGDWRGWGRLPSPIYSCITFKCVLTHFLHTQKKKNEDKAMNATYNCFQSPNKQMKPQSWAHLSPGSDSFVFGSPLYSHHVLVGVMFQFFIMRISIPLKKPQPPGHNDTPCPIIGLNNQNNSQDTIIVKSLVLKIWMISSRMTIMELLSRITVVQDGLWQSTSNIFRSQVET